MTSENKFILDATAGFRMMWFNKKHPNAIYLDQRPECEPDIVGDFRDLSVFSDESFKLVVFDPPHIIDRNTGENRTGMLNDFGSLRYDTWRSDLKKAFSELWRVLKEHGILICKWNTTSVSSNEILKLIKTQPLFYQVSSNKKRKRSHSNCQTLWFCFMKITEFEKGEKHE